MKRIIIISIVVALAAATPWYFGTKIEEQAQVQLALANQQLALNPEMEARIEQESYQRGWLSSRAVWKMTVTLRDRVQENGDPLTFSNEFVLDMLHGPVLLDETLQFGSALIKIDLDIHEILHNVFLAAGETLPQSWTALLSAYPPVRQRVRVDFAGLNHWSVDAPKFDHRFEDGRRLEWSGMTADGVAPVDWQQVEGQMNAGRLVVSGPEGKAELQVDEFQMDMNLSKIRPLMSYGTTRVSIGRIDINVPDESKISVSELTLSGQVAAEAGVIREQFLLNVGKIESADVPGFARDSGVRVELDVDGMDEPEMDRLGDAYEKFVQSAQSEEEALAFLSGMEALLKASLAHKPGMQLQLALQLPENQSVDASVKLQLTELDVAAVMQQPELALQSLQGQAKVQLPQQWLIDVVAHVQEQGFAALVEADVMTQEEAATVAMDQARGGIEAMMAQGLAIQKGPVLETTATLEQGLKLNVNGRLIPLPAL